MRGSIRVAAVLAAALALVALAPASASAATGAITKALATPDWTSATVAGSVTWAGCELQPPKSPEEPEPPKEEAEEEPPPVGPVITGCSWTPFVTIGPGTDASECSAPGRQQPEALGPGIVLAWKGSTSAAEGTVSFEISDMPLDGSKNQLVCLSLLEQLEEVMAAKTLTSYGPLTVSRSLASAFLTEMTPTKPCLCPPEPHPRRHRHHRKHHRHRHIFVSQHQKVPEA